MDSSVGLVAMFVGVFILGAILFKSIHRIGPSEIGLVNKRLAIRKLDEGNPIAFRGEAGYQATMLMPGLRWKFWPIFAVTKYPWVQIPAGEIGVVISQVGRPLPIGAKSAVYQAAFGHFTDLHAFIDGGGGKGVQRPVLPPGTLAPIHPVAFLVLSSQQVYGLPIDPDLAYGAGKGGGLRPEHFGLTPEELRVTVIAPQGDQDFVGIVTVLEGEPLPSGDIASRIGGFEDIRSLEQQGASVPDLIEVILGSKASVHNAYQDVQAFLDAGGRIGLQYDPLLYGAYLLNPFLVKVELVPMLVVNQGEVAVIKSFVGLPTTDTSGPTFKFGSIVRPGHRGIWEEPLRTGKYALNPRVYAAEIVPTFILTLNWAAQTSEAHNLDARLSAIEGKSREGFVFRIDLQVQIHVSDVRAPRVISMVGTMENLVNEVLQSAVGNHFRNTLQQLEAVKFIETRDQVQENAFTVVTEYLEGYEVETRGVYIQDVVFPEQLVEVLTRREIARQEQATYVEQQRAETARIETEKAKGMADMQSRLATAQVQVDISASEAQAREKKAEGEAAYVRLTGQAEADKTAAIGLAQATAVEAIGVARAAGFKEQREAIGETATAVVAVASAVSDGHLKVVPDVLVTGGGGSLDALASTLVRTLGTGSGNGMTNGGSAKRSPTEPSIEPTDPEASIDLPRPETPDVPDLSATKAATKPVRPAPETGDA